LAYILNNHKHTGNLFVGTATTAANPYSVSGANGYTNTTWTTAANPMTVTQQATIQLNGEKADIVINGKSLKDTLEALESRLAMLKPDVSLETEWAELKRLGDEYRKLELEIKEKMKTWDTLKNTSL
jgi:predicted RNase H-like nuclease (RuvC/YqgF family)